MIFSLNNFNNASYITRYVEDAIKYVHPDDYEQRVKRYREKIEDSSYATIILVSTDTIDTLNREMLDQRVNFRDIIINAVDKAIRDVCNELYTEDAEKVYAELCEHLANSTIYDILSHDSGSDRQR